MSRDRAKAASLWFASAVAIGVLSYLPLEVPSGRLDHRFSKRQLPTITIVDLDGNAHSTANWRGKTTLVNFWATWCRPCVRELPDLIALQRDLSDELRIVGLAVDEANITALAEFTTDVGINYTVANSTPQIRELFPEVTALPTSFLIDRSGRLTARIVGRIDRALIEEWVLLEQAVPPRSPGGGRQGVWWQP